MSQPRVTWLWRLTLVGLVLDWCIMFAGTHIPVPPESVLPLSDKTLHFSGFWTLGFLLAATLTLRARWTWWRFAATLMILAIYGALDEWTQPLVGRDCDFYDWVADMFGAVGGAVLGVLAVVVVRRIFLTAPKIG